MWPERRLSARESASSSIPPETASVRGDCGGPWPLASSRGGGSQCDLQIWWIGRYGASDAFKLAVNGVSGRSGSRWPDSASGLALLRLAAVNGLQSCGPTLGIDSMQSVGACVAACGGGWGKGSLAPVYCSESSAASMRPRQCPYCIVYGLHVGWPRYRPHASQLCYCSPASVEIVSVIA